MIASQLFLIHQRGQSTGSGDLHCVGDLSGTHIQRTAEYSGEAQHVVYLIRKIRTPCGHHRCAGCDCLIGKDLRGRIGTGENDRLIRHAPDHLLRKLTGCRNPDEHIRAANDIPQCSPFMHGICQPGHLFLDRIEMLPAFPDGPMPVGQDHIFKPYCHQQAHDGDARRAGAAGDDFHIFQTLSNQLERIHESRQHDYCRSMLIVVKDGDVQAGFQALFDLKAARS